MRITPRINHGKLRYCVNIQQGGVRKRLFFPTLAEAEAFVAATGGQVRYGHPRPRLSQPPPAPAYRPAPPAPPTAPRRKPEPKRSSWGPIIDL